MTNLGFCREAPNVVVDEKVLELLFVYWLRPVIMEMFMMLSKTCWYILLYFLLLKRNGI